MLRWVRRIVVLLSLASTITLAVFWSRSRTTEDRLFGTRGERYWQVTSRGGRVRLITIEDYPAPVAWRWDDVPRQERPPSFGEWADGVGKTYLSPRAGSSFGPLAWDNGVAYIDAPLALQEKWRRLTSPSSTVPARVATTSPATARSGPSYSLGRIPDAVLSNVAKEFELPDLSSGFSLSAPPASWSSTPSPNPSGATMGGGGGTPGFGRVESVTGAPATRGTLAAGSLVVRVGVWMRPFTYRSVTLRYEVLLALSALPTLAGLVLVGGRLWRGGARRRAGLCLACGYDLRGSADAARCPECGMSTLGRGSRP
ncbi:MAG TPA: hypothetical protein VH475_22225 [Tepidisphaeraceae bacterium]